MKRAKGTPSAEGTHIFGKSSFTRKSPAPEAGKVRGPSTMTGAHRCGMVLAEALMRRTNPIRTPMPLLAGAAAFLLVLVGLVGVAGAAGGSHRAHAGGSSSLEKKVKRLNRALRRLNRTIGGLRRKLDAVSKQAGPQGKTGPQGDAGPRGEQGPPGPTDLAALDTRYWRTTGNAGAAPGTHFLGTTDASPFELRVAGGRALRLEPASNGFGQSPNVVAGIAENTVEEGAYAATIAGGGQALQGEPGSANVVEQSLGTVGGGGGNHAGAFATVGGGGNNGATGQTSAIAGGFGNTASATGGAVGGGEFNTAGEAGATVGGGFDNAATGSLATVSGGGSNAAPGVAATVPGGTQNSAQGGSSLAAGHRAKAEHNGAFVWGDSQDNDIASSAEDQFIARAAGNFFLQSDSTLDDQGGFLNTSTGAYLSSGGTWTNSSDQNLKRDFASIEPREVLDRVTALPVTTWRYKAEAGARHIGPTAQDFYRAFSLGADNRHIGSIDADGVALAAIKGLDEKVDSLTGSSPSLGDGANSTLPPPLALVAFGGLAILLSAALASALTLRAVRPR